VSLKEGSTSHLTIEFASMIWIRIGPDQSQCGHDKIPVVTALKSISARFITCPHLGQICALISRFSEFISRHSVQCCNRSSNCFNTMLFLPNDFSNYPKVAVRSRRGSLDQIESRISLVDAPVGARLMN